MSLRAKRWRSTSLTIVAVALGLFSVAGYWTAGTLQAPGYQTAARIYLGLLLTSLVLAVFAIVARHRDL